MAKENPTLISPNPKNSGKVQPGFFSIKASLFSFNNTAFYNRKNFNILSAVVFVFMVLVSTGFGVNGDEKFQVDYAQKLWSYYSTFGKDTAALNVPEGKMHLYGGLFDLSSMAINKLLGLKDQFDPHFHITRRILCAVFGFIALFFTALFGKQIGGWPLAFLSMVLVFLSPRFFGDVMINPKDVPFAAGYIMTLYFISKFIRELPKPDIKSMIGIVVGVMIALNTRAGGILLILYLLFFAIGFILLQPGTDKKFDNREKGIGVLYTLGTALVAYLAGIVFWPYALQNPLTHPYLALTEFTHQPITMPVLFNGQHLNSGNLPWNYLPEWIIRTIPLSCLIGIFFFLRLLSSRKQYIPLVETVILSFAFLFPIFFAIYKHSTLHDGWRHFIFIFPPLMLLASFGWYLWFTSFLSKYFNLISVVILLGLITENIYSIISLHPYQYIYFNPLFGGVKKAYGNFETDYWMLSLKEASSWLDGHARLSMNKKHDTVSTNAMYPAQVYLKNGQGNDKVIYLSYSNRRRKNWDFGLYYSRFIPGHQLLNKSWPPKGTIQTIKAGGIPLCAIIKRENREDFLGFEALNNNNFDDAVKHLVSALEYDEFNEAASFDLATIFKSRCQYDLAEQSIRQSLNAFPENSAAIQLLQEIQYEKKHY